MSRPQFQPEVPVQSLTAIAQTALSCGVGMLLAGKLRRKAQRNTGAVMLSVGALCALPVLYEVLSRRWRGPNTERGMRKTLESIRHDPGISEDADVF